VGRRLLTLRKVVGGAGELAEKERWFASLDAASDVQQFRHFHMFCVDWAILLQSASPYRHDIRFRDELGDVFRKEGQSLQVASHILHDDRLFQVQGCATDFPGSGPLARNAVVE
jgi:hypothetical protein